MGCEGGIHVAAVVSDIAAQTEAVAGDVVWPPVIAVNGHIVDGQGRQRCCRREIDRLEIRRDAERDWNDGKESPLSQTPN